MNLPAWMPEAEKAEWLRRDAEIRAARAAEQEQNDKEKAKSDAQRARVAKILGELTEIGVANPVTIMPELPTLEDLLANYISEYVYEDISWETAIYARRNGMLPDVKVQMQADGQLNCNGNHKADMIGTCGHRADFCIRRELPVPGGFFGTASRSEPSIQYRPPGTGNDFTARNKANRTSGRRVRQFLFALCKNVEDPRPKQTDELWRPPGSAGQPKAPLRCLVYAAAVKVIFRLDYFALRDTLMFDPYFRQLGWKSLEPPHENSLWPIMGSKLLWEVVAGGHRKDPENALIRRTARQGRLLDYAVALDGSGFGTTMLQNWLQSKWGNAEKKKRRKQPKPWTKRKRKKSYIPTQVAFGLQSGLIYQLYVTAEDGVGTHDDFWFMPLMDVVFEIGADPELILADLAYYDQLNYEYVQGKNKLLFVMSKRNADVANMDVGRELAAYMMALLERRPDLYRRFYRLRPVIESVFSAQKRRTGHCALKTRKWERDRIRELGKEPYEPVAGAPAATKAAYRELCRALAQERVGYARRNEAALKALGHNLRRLVRLEYKYAKGQPFVNFDMDTAFVPGRFVSLPF